MNTTIGTCGNCGGPVQVPHVWHGVIPPTPTCAHCGSVAKANHGPVLPMEPPRKPRSAPSTDVDPEVLKSGAAMDTATNAELISSAPELLSALRYMVANIGEPMALETRDGFNAARELLRRIGAA